MSPAILVFLWMLSLSLKNEIDNLAYPPVFIPDPPTLNNFVQVFAENSMGRYFWNSVVVSGGATLIALLVGIPAGYGIARAQAHKLTVLILIARMTPALSYLIPLYTVFQFLGLSNTLDGARDHAPGHHRADHRLHHGRSLRDACPRSWRRPR